jgi:hypothetical protein
LGAAVTCGGQILHPVVLGKWGFDVEVHCDELALVLRVEDVVVFWDLDQLETEGPLKATIIHVVRLPPFEFDNFFWLKGIL